MHYSNDKIQIRKIFLPVVQKKVSLSIVFDKKKLSEERKIDIIYQSMKLEHPEITLDKVQVLFGNRNRVKCVLTRVWMIYRHRYFIKWVHRLRSR